MANTIKQCIFQLQDLSDDQARYYCGFTLMKYCAVHLGLDGYPLKFDVWNQNDLLLRKKRRSEWKFLFFIYYYLFCFKSLMMNYCEREKKIKYK